MAPGDVLILFTDGLVEAQDADGTEFGDEKVVSAAQALPEASANEIFERIIVDTFNHAKESGFNDDMTLLVIKRCGNGL
jgi:sigma-B regulation protein RsbU (phosphoserine phosphatase)